MSLGGLIAASIPLVVRLRVPWIRSTDQMPKRALSCSSNSLPWSVVRPAKEVSSSTSSLMAIATPTSVVLLQIGHINSPFQAA